MPESPEINILDLDELDFAVDSDDAVDISFDSIDDISADLGNPTIIQNNDHRTLNHRDAADQHPISAITDLEDWLDNIDETTVILSESIEELDRDKQDKLVSGVNIKTVKQESLLGSGNVDTDPDALSILEIYDIVNS